MRRLTPFLALFSVLVPFRVAAQVGPSDIRAEIRLMSVVTQAQVISLTTIGVDTRGRGQRVMELVLQNNTNRRIDNLYLHVQVSSSSVGVIAHADTDNHRPFSLLPNQLIVADNNRLYTGIPGLEGGTSITGQLTPEGDRFIESLEGTTRLPDAVYTTVLSIFQGGNRLNGGRLVTSFTQNIGSAPIANVVDFNIVTPGGPLGGGDQIGSVQPTFRWEGPVNTDYRLIVVQDPGRGQSAESLIQAALSTAPGGVSGGTATLLENEMLDMVVRANNYFYPTTGAKALRPGRKYYWQVIAQIRSSRGVESRPSAIYEFTITNPQASANAEIQAAVAPLLAQASPEIAAAFQQLVDGGFQLDRLVVEGREMSGVQLRAFLEEFFEKVKRGEIILVKGS